MRFSSCFAFTGILVLIAGCASAPKDDSPAWVHQPTRTVDNGFIVYVGSDTGDRADRVQFKAEGLALEDLANECSLIPKGARIEDRYTKSDKGETTSYVKLALEFQECEEAKHANDPDAIRRVANVAFTEQLKKYQDLIQTGDMEGTVVADADPNQEIQPPPPLPPAGTATVAQVYVVRQYVAYQKEVVILAPPAVYAANTPAAVSFQQHIPAAVEQVHVVETANPAIANSAWSQVPNRPVLARPMGLTPPVMRAAAPPGGGFAHGPMQEVHPPGGRAAGGQQPHWNTPPNRRNHPIPPRRNPPPQIRKRRRHSDKK